MSHFAKVENGIVISVIVAEQDFINTIEGKWVQTSYNSLGGVHYLPNSNVPSGKPHLRFNYAGIGFSYNEELDAFIPPKPFYSWVLNKTYCMWESPVPYPNDNKSYIWNEELLNWDLIQGL